MKVPQPPPVPPPDGDEEDLRLWEVEQKATNRILEKIAKTGTVVYKDQRRDQRKQDKKPENRYLVRWRKEADDKLVIEEPEVIRQCTKKWRGRKTTSQPYLYWCLLGSG